MSDHRITKMKCVRIVLVCCLWMTSTAVNAQNSYTRVAAGFNYAFPQLQKGYSTEPWKGVHVRSKFLEVGYLAGKPINPSEQQVLGFNAYFGVNVPFMKAAFGKRAYGIKGCSVVPFVAANIGFLGIGGVKMFHITAAPGVSLQLPYTVVDFRLNTSFGFKNVPGLLKYKVLLAPTLVLQLDALWDVMDPELKFDARYEGWIRETEQTGQDDKYTYYTTTYTHYTQDVLRYNVGAHISLGPRISYWNLKDGNNKTFMAGLVQSGRASNFGYDLIAETGKITADGEHELKSTRALGRLSINLNISKSGHTQFTRLMIGGGIGYNWFTQSSPFVHSENGEFFNLFASLEFGAIGFSYEVNKAFYEKFDDQKYFAFTYRIPFDRVIMRYRQLKESK